jgi:hypothetical protein
MCGSMQRALPEWLVNNQGEWLSTAMRISWGSQTKLIDLERYFKSVKSRSEKKAASTVKKQGQMAASDITFFGKH